MVAKVTAGLFLLNRFDQSSRSTHAPNPRYGSRVPAVARFGGSAGAGKGAGGIEVVVVVVADGVVMAVPAPTGVKGCGATIGSGSMTAPELTEVIGTCGTVAVTPAATATTTTGVGSTRACGAVVVASVGSGGTGTVAVVMGLGLDRRGFLVPLFVAVFAVGFRPVNTFGFTLTVLVAVLTAVALTAVLTVALTVVLTVVLIVVVRRAVARR